MGNDFPGLILDAAAQQHTNHVESHFRHAGHELAGFGNQFVSDIRNVSVFLFDKDINVLVSIKFSHW